MFAGHVESAELPKATLLAVRSPRDYRFEVGVIREQNCRKVFGNLGYNWVRRALRNLFCSTNDFMATLFEKGANRLRYAFVSEKR